MFYPYPTTMRILWILLLLPSLLAAPNQTQEPMPQAQSIAEANNRFHFDFYAAALKSRQSHNVFASSFSVSSAFALLYPGASGATADELRRVFHFSPSADFHQQFGEMLRALSHHNAPEHSLEVANAVWLRQALKLQPNYEQLVKTAYNAEINLLDFTQPQQAADRINTWTAQKTHDKIQKILDASDLQPDTRLVLTNALYFKSAWATPFPKHLTSTQPFYGATTTECALMQQERKFRYFENELLQVIELPYHDGKASMLIFLPKDKGRLAALEEAFDYQNYQVWTAALRPELVQTYLPKFKIESSFQLNGTLEGMGLATSFQNTASFRGLIEQESLKISNVLHKAFVEVDEEGSEAAAVTAITMVRTTSVAEPIRQIAKVFRADHPFLFVIRDNAHGNILFSGKVLRP